MPITSTGGIELFSAVETLTILPFCHSNDGVAQSWISDQTRYAAKRSGKRVEWRSLLMVVLAKAISDQSESLPALEAIFFNAHHRLRFVYSIEKSSKYSQNIHISTIRDLSTSSARQLKGGGAVVVDKSALPD